MPKKKQPAADADLPGDFIVRSKRDLAAVVGVSDKTLLAWARTKGMPGGAAGPWNIRHLFQWALSRQRTAADDSLMVGTSPASERFRQAKAEMAELDLAERRGQLVNRIAWLEWLARLATHLRRGAEQLQRDFGEAAADIHREAMAEWLREYDAEAARPPAAVPYHTWPPAPTGPLPPTDPAIMDSLPASAPELISPTTDLEATT